MIRGLLLKYMTTKFVQLDESCLMIVFLCPKCDQLHQLWGTFSPAFTQNNFKAWHYELDDTKSICTISPEIEFDKFCGFKSTNPWELEVQILEYQEQITDEVTAWLRSGTK